MAMTWTLRHLLDYLDDKLDPEQTRRLGQVIAEHDGAQKIVDRLRHITRKRRLSAPELDTSAHAEDHPGEPNIVAAYLDDRLSADETAELEKLCHESDVYLAEVAACHQIVSVGNSEPVLIPPMARQRMYGLVEGPEADPNRPIKAAAAPVLVYDVDGEVGEGEGDLLLEPVWQRMRRQASVLLPVAALLLFVVLIALVYSIGNVPEEAIVAGHSVPPGEGPQPAPAVVAQKPAPQPDNKQPPAVTKAPQEPVLVAWPAVMSGLDKADQRAAWMVSASIANLASRPAMPPNFLLGLGREEWIVHAEKPMPVVEKPPVPAPPLPAPVKPVPQMVGRLAADAQKEGLLLRWAEESGDWRVVRSLAAINSEEKLLALPGYRSEIDLTPRGKLLLFGSVPTTQPNNFFFETAVVLHTGAGADLDVTLERGRIVLSSKPEVANKVRLRFLTQTWDLHLPPGAAVAVEATGRVAPGSGPWVPHHKVSFFVLNGTVEATRLGKKALLQRGTLLAWDSTQVGPGAGTALPQAEPPAWVAPKPPMGEVKRTLTTFHDSIFKKIQNQERELPWITIACDEALTLNRETPKLLALFTLAALDQLRPVVAALENATAADVRRAALAALIHSLGRQPGQDEVLRRTLRDRGYRDDEAELLLSLLRRVDKPDRAVIERLLGYLTHHRLSIRELAYQNLVLLLPQERLGAYNPAAPTEQLETAVEQLKKRLLR